MPDTSRSLVYHCRMIWLAAAGGLTDVADEGCRLLWDRFWDQDYGGFFWQVGFNGSSLDPEKHLYGNAFAVFALARAGKAEDANWAFQWLDLHAHDDEHGGYVETLWSDGEKRLSGDGLDSMGTPYGLKSQNTNLHILEALIELYKLSGDTRVRARLQEVFDLFRTRYVLPDGRLIYYTTQELHQASDVDSYGHALESAFLLIEAAEALHDKVDETWELGRVMVDRAIAAGWDDVHGGVFNEGHFDQPAHDRRKIWWVQAESFNVFRLMAEKYGSPYAEYRDRQLKFIEDTMIDHEHGGWRPTVNEDGSRIPGHIKSDAWTEGYHQGRAILLATLE